MVIVDYVDENDKTLGSVEFDEVVKTNLTYREVLVMIANEAGDVFLKKDNDRWGTSLRGVLIKGEVYEDAALRLLEDGYSKVKESELDFYSKDYLSNDDGTRRFLEIYKIKLVGPFEAPGEFCSMKKIRRMADRGEEFSPELQMILKNYYRINVGVVSSL